MTEHPAAIPTYYDGVQYRSRLEARWAAFFHACGWVADYEPIDLVGYIPDFVLRWPAGQHLVECKPVTDAAGLTPHRTRLYSSAAVWLNEPAERARWWEAELRRHDEEPESPELFRQICQLKTIDKCLDEIARAEAERRGVLALGAVIHGEPSRGQVLTIDGLLGFVVCPNGPHVGLTMTGAVDYCRVCGYNLGVMEAVIWVDPGSLLQTWRAAGNAVQYRAP